MKTEPGILEWYVMSIGNKPAHIILGRREALFRFSYKFDKTLRESQQLGRAWELGVAVGESLLLTAYAKNPDRTLTRVAGPEIK